MLFDPISLSELRFKNRIFVSPMCQYSARNGVPGDWHLVHLGSRAVGGAALVLTEATAVSAVGRISPGDTGLWNDEQEKAF
ncbi:MAG: oxidoreductase, partial [Bdellovibrionota bacterium]